MPPFPSLTETWHDKPYEAIDPTKPSLSAKGKVVVITGGGGAIGKALVKAFAIAGADKIAVVGRREETLHETRKAVESIVPGANLLVVKGDISDEKAIQGAFSTIARECGKIDILVANAGYLPEFHNVKDAEPGEWWKGFEVNTKGAFNTARAFIPVASSNAILVDISTGPIHMPAMAGGSGYLASKLASKQVYESVGAENPNIDVIHVHPGVVYSDINVKSGVTPVDDADLPGQFVLWATSPEAEFLRGNPGRFLWSNWDVEELKARKEELKQPGSLILTMNGWPFGQEANMDALAF